MKGAQTHNKQYSHSITRQCTRLESFCYVSRAMCVCVHLSLCRSFCTLTLSLCIQHFITDRLIAEWFLFCELSLPQSFAGVHGIAFSCSYYQSCLWYLINMCASKVLFTLLTLVMSRKCTGVSFLRKKNGPGIIKLLYRHIWTQLVPYWCTRLTSSVKFISQKEMSAPTYVRTYIERHCWLHIYTYLVGSA